MAHSNRSRALPRPLSILDDGKEFLRLTTLTDVRDFLKRLPKKSRADSKWQHVEATLKQAAAGGDATELWAALQMVLMLEKVEYRLE